MCHTDPAAPGFGSVVVDGLSPQRLAALEALDARDADWPRVFSVRSERARPGWPSLLGTYALEGGSLRFEPRFPVAPGTRYRAEFQHGGETASAVCAFPEAAAGPRTRVEAVFPSDTLVPENLLRVYIHFTAPMRAQDVHEHVHLYDAAGADVELPFVEVRSGLWDPSGRRLTLFLHPGRIKRGVAPNRELGPVLRTGESFRVVVDAGLRDAGGEPLAAAFERVWRTAAADRRSPDPRRWRLAAPAADDDAVRLDLDEPLDRALLARYVSVRDAAGAPVEGSAQVTAGETRWVFHPARPWAPGMYAIHVDPRLEDRAGNRIDRLFDAQREPGAATAPGDSRPVVLSFGVGAQATP